jgi:hypothetical protein
MKFPLGLVKELLHYGSIAGDNEHADGKARRAALLAIGALSWRGVRRRRDAR